MLDMTKYLICYEIVMRSSVVIRATISTAIEERDPRDADAAFPRCALQQLAAAALLPKLETCLPARSPLVSLVWSRERLVGRATDSRPFRSVQRDQKSWGSVYSSAAAPPFSGQRGQRPSSGRASARDHLERSQPPRARRAK